jgi:hypothetical protein
MTCVLVAYGMGALLTGLGGVIYLPQHRKGPAHSMLGVLVVGTLLWPLVWWLAWRGER